MVHIKLQGRECGRQDGQRKEIRIRDSEGRMERKKLGKRKGAKRMGSGGEKLRLEGVNGICV